MLPSITIEKVLREQYVRFSCSESVHPSAWQFAFPWAHTSTPKSLFVLSLSRARQKRKDATKKNICPYGRGGEEDDGGVHNDDDERAGASATNGEATWLIISGRGSGREAAKEPCRGRVPGESGVGAMGTGTMGPRELNARRVRTAGTGGRGGG